MESVVPHDEASGEAGEGDDRDDREARPPVPASGLLLEGPSRPFRGAENLGQ